MRKVSTRSDPLSVTRWHSTLSLKACAETYAAQFQPEREPPSTMDTSNE